MSVALFSRDRYGKGDSGIKTAKRFLLTQALTLYANKRFQLEKSGQRAIVFFSTD